MKRIEVGIGRRLAAVMAAGLAAAGAAEATYVQYGEGMQTILAGTLDHAALQVQSAMTWTNDIPGGTTYTITPSFAAPVADEVHVARLALTIWGGTRDYTATVNLRLNGAVTPFASIELGTTGDANPSFDPDAANVYGTGFGVWLVTVPVPTNDVRRDGTSNAFAIEVTDPSGQFDKRIQQVTLLSVYENVSLTHRLSWFVAEGSGDIYRSQVGAVASREVTLGATPGGAVDSAILTALYTYGEATQNDRLLFNGASVGGDNVADKADNYAALNYVPDLVQFDVTAGLAPLNTVRFTVDSADGVPDTREVSLRPSLAALAISQPIPEPAGALLLLAGAAALLLGRRRS